MNTEDIKIETDAHHILRHFTIVLALIIGGIILAETTLSSTTLLQLPYNFYKLLLAGIIGYVLFCYGLFPKESSRFGSFLSIAWRAILRCIIYPSIVIIASLFWSKNNGIECAGLLTITLILAWCLSLLPPLSKKFTKTDIILEKDHLYRENLADSLTKLIKNRLANDDNNLNRIAIKGEWGSGKTDLLHRITKRLQNIDQDGITYSVQLVSPWLSEDKIKAHAVITKGLEKAFGVWSPNTSVIAKWISPILSMVGVKLPGKTLTSALTNSDSFLKEASLRLINEEFIRKNKRAVIIVDDMERASKEAIRSIFPSLNSLKSLKSCCFIFAIDPERMCSSFTSALETQGYINKVFDLQFSLPQVEEREILQLANSEVDRQHPKLKASIEILLDVLPKNPRALKRWIEICKAKEEMFFQDVFEDKEKNFAAFYLKELIEYLFPGFERVARSSRLDTLTKKDQEEAYADILKNLCGFKSEDKQKADSPKNKTSTSDVFFESEEKANEESFKQLYLFLIGLLQSERDGSKFSFNWACSEYAMIVGLTSKYRILLKNRFLLHPEDPFEKTVTLVYELDAQVDSNLTSMQFFDHFFKNNIMANIKYQTDDNKKELSELDTNLSALNIHLKTLTKQPPYLQDRFYGFLKYFGPLENISQCIEPKPLKTLYLLIKSATHWANLVSLPELRGILIRMKSQGWEMTFGMHSNDKAPENYCWYPKLKKSFQIQFAKKIASVISEEDFISAYRKIDKDRDIDTFIMSDAPLLVKKEQVELFLKKQHISNSFLSCFLQSYFGDQLTYDDFEKNMMLRMNQDSFFSFLAMEEASQLPKEIIQKYAQTIKSRYNELTQDSLKLWFKENFLGSSVTTILELS